MTERKQRATTGVWARLRIPALALLALAAVLGVIAATRLLDATPRTVDLELDGRLALLPFVDATARRADRWVETGLMEMVAGALEHPGGVRLVAPERLRRALDARGLDTREPQARARARAVAHALGADLVLDAAVDRRRAGYAIDFTVYDRAGEVEDGEVEGPDALAAAGVLTYSLARALGSAEPPRLDRVFSGSPFLDRLYGMGLQALRAGDPETARSHFAIAADNRPGFLRAEARLVECALALGELERARTLALELVAETQKLGERFHQAAGQRALARVAALEGDFDQAAELYAQAYAIHVERGDLETQAELLDELARLALARGAAERAEELYSQRLEIQAELGDAIGRADTLLELGSLHLAGRELDEAHRALEGARVVARDQGDRWTEMRAVSSLGELARLRRDPETATGLWRQALAFYDQRRDRARQLLLNRKLADAYLTSGELEAAEDRLYEMRDLAVELEDPASEARASLGLAWLLLRTGYPRQARPHLDRAMALDRHLEDRFDLQRVIAWFAYEQGNYRLALDTQREIKRQAGPDWRATDEAFLRAYERAHRAGERVPLPGESA